ncbi:Leucine-rich repeat and calponin like proteiny domain-containing protein 2 [Willisornis vidua]|uniref:Leucine-rich repeat and calponin like proteiny domain-containing protein 2 n=1 Tax=Willisornis vidua TaxID=1566151 RepID=A0ABQ9D446_9PASS|nr:Leucine-rich repeat and calponin like proteiny domain-containing protein 2 [Willisornis vidua]
MAAGQGGGGGNNGSGGGSGAAGLGIPGHLTLSFSAGPHWGAAALPQPHTVRSLERALEEAGSSGILCLSGRKLRDFPGSGCDLSDTTQAVYTSKQSMFSFLNEVIFVGGANVDEMDDGRKNLTHLNQRGTSGGDLNEKQELHELNHQFGLFNVDESSVAWEDLSKNRFTEIPPDVWLFAPLETLNLYHNCIKSIPESIKNLQMLTYLNISRNLLSTLPKYLFDLPLKVLVVSNNKLVSIPEEIGKLRDLMELICLKGKVHIFKFLSIQACLRIDKKPDSLDLPSLGKRIPSQPLTDSMEDFYPNKNHGPDSGIGSDNGDKRLSTTEPSDDDTISLHSQVSESTREQTLRNDNHVMGSKLDPQKDQETYDYIDPNAEEGAPPEQGDAQTGTLLSYVKERGKHPEKSQKIEQNEDWGDEKRLQKEQLLAEDDDELKEVTDLRKIAAQLLQQEQKHSVSTNEVNSPVSPYSWQPLENQKDSVDEQHWPETQPVIWQNEERRRSKQIRKEYFKYKSSRKSSSGNENDEQDSDNTNVSPQSPVSSEDYERTDSNSHGPFGLKPRSAFSRASRQDYGAVDPGFTMRRKMEHLREEREQIRQLRNNLESRLKVILPDDIGAALMDGVVLCHLANHIRPRSVASIHVPSPAVERLCLPHHILEERGLVKVGLTVQALLELPALKVSQLSSV